MIAAFLGWLQKNPQQPADLKRGIRKKFLRAVGEALVAPQLAEREKTAKAPLKRTIQMTGTYIFYHHSLVESSQLCLSVCFSVFVFPYSEVPNNRRATLIYLRFLYRPIFSYWEHNDN